MVQVALYLNTDPDRYSILKKAGQQYLPAHLYRNVNISLISDNPLLFPDMSKLKKIHCG
jgi:hypothetical protein